MQALRVRVKVDTLRGVSAHDARGCINYSCFLF